MLKASLGNDSRPARNYALRHLGRRSIAGFSLVELMISVTLGLIVMGGVIGIFASTVKSHSDTLKMTRLHQELRAAMDIMSRDIRRAGYRGDAQNGDENPFTTSFNLSVIGTGLSNCIAYAYDANRNGGAVQNRDRFGFRLDSEDSVGIIRGRNGGAGALDCTFASVQPITDEKTVDITRLNFKLDSAIVGTRTIRSVVITLNGRLINDTTVKRTLRETVRIQNDA